MASFLSEIINVGANISTYSRSAWDVLLSEAAADIAGLTEFYTLGTKKVSILNNNFTYISASTSVVNSQSTPDDFQGRADFTYYTSDNDPLTKRDSKPLLVDPSSDAREDIKDNFNPKIDSSAGNATYDSFNGIKTDYIYNEHQIDSSQMSGEVGTKAGILEFTNYDSIVTTDQGTLVGKTNRWLKGVAKGVKDDYISKRFKTVISRFHTSNDASDIDDIENGVSNSAYSKKYGLSHGRNLLKTNVDPKDPYDNPYDNPYCRVWTYHHQYNKFVADTMRPFSGHSLGDLEDADTYWEAMRSASYGTNFPSGGKRLQQFGTMFDNNGDTTGLINITPKWDSGHGGVNGNYGVSLKHCMFSIENLAWKGLFNDYGTEMEEFGLSNEQKGPFGGRIMWFPPYDLKFSENSNAKWNQNEFIGRGEPIYTYSNTTRSGQLSFKLLIDHPSILDYWEKRDETGNEKNSTVDDLYSKEQMMLRFFAGCEILKARKPEEIVEKEPPVETPKPVLKDKIFQFFVFYPNNYSGKDDKIGGTVNPIHYLMGGIGAQQRVTSANTVIDFGVDLTTPITYNGIEMGGYEMRYDYGIGVDRTETLTKIIASGVTQGSDSITLAKMMSDTTRKSWRDYNPSWKLSKRRDWHKKKYYYRADRDTLDQVLIGDDNTGAVSYMDKNSYQLNSVGFTKAMDYWSLKDKDVTYSLAEVFTVLEPSYASYSTPFCRPDELEELKKIISENKDRITSVHFKGRASSQQNNKSESLNIKRNKILAKNRAITIKKWLISTLGISADKFKDIEFAFDRTRNEIQDDSNDYYAKLNRFCLVEIHYSVEETEDASKVNVSITSGGNIDNNSKTIYGTKTNGVDNSKITDKGNVKDSQKKTQRKNKRYDDEAKFFKKIQVNDPFFFKLLSERVKYFNPAFHSLSPEGFNARLTFLNQCLRQGPTISMSDGHANANNLAFGRPPVCILRIGDFYYTKIIVESLSINYDPLVWDLNEEGIGTMPMIADVTLNFNFIGGSELAGPIQRLQNAISFNYYANTSVYDNRSEITRYNENNNDTYQSQGEVIAFKPYFGPNTNLEI